MLLFKLDQPTTKAPIVAAPTSRDRTTEATRVLVELVIVSPLAQTGSPQDVTRQTQNALGAFA